MDQPNPDVARDRPLGRLVADALDQLEKLGYSRRSLRRYRTRCLRLSHVTVVLSAAAPTCKSSRFRPR